jgi:hypothetical protein
MQLQQGRAEVPEFVHGAHETDPTREDNENHSEDTHVIPTQNSTYRN